MRVLVTGAAGMLGRAVLRAARHQPDIQTVGGVRSAEQATALEHEGYDVQLCDISDKYAVARMLAQDIHVVVNCAGITKARATDPIEAIRINSLAPHLLARACRDRKVRLIQISTDCVFSGIRGNYTEDDVPDPVDLYGRSKLLGEVVDDGCLTVRTSVIGREVGTRYGLVEWLLSQTGKVPGYGRALWSGLTAPALARLLLELGRCPNVNGLLNVAGETVDKCTLLQWLKEAFHRDDVQIEMKNEPVIDRSLTSSRFQALGFKLPSLSEMIAELAAGSSESKRQT